MERDGYTICEAAKVGKASKIEIDVAILNDFCFASCEGGGVNTCTFKRVNRAYED